MAPTRLVLGGLAALISVAALDLGRVAWLDDAFRLDASGDAPTVATFGYGPTHPGVAVSPVTADDYRPLRVRTLPNTEDASHVMPLYINGVADPLPGLAGRHVLLVSGDYWFRAIDIERDTVLWSVSQSNPMLTSAPVLDRTRARIYFAASKRAPQIGGPRWANGDYEIGLFSVRTDGTDLDRLDIDLSRLLAYEGLEPEAPPSTIMQCRTALGLVDRPETHFVHVGCSMHARHLETHYGNSRGARGALVAAHLESDGSFAGPKAIDVFSPSPVGGGDASGFDAGIWSTGAGPGLLPDGSLILATGNGPFRPDLESYGCSVLRVDAKTLTLAEPPDGSPPYYSLDTGDYSECHSENLDLASSSVATLEVGGRLYSVITGKDGTIKSFDPYDLPGSADTGRHELKIGGELFGQPSIYRTDTDAIHVVAGGRQAQEYLRLGVDVVLSPRSETALLEAAGYELGVCVGLARGDESRGGQALELYHSGPFRGDRTLLVSGSVPEALLSSGRFRPAMPGERVGSPQTARLAPYRAVRTVGWTVSEESAIPAGLRLTPLVLRASRAAGFFTFPQGASLDVLPSATELSVTPSEIESAPVRGIQGLDPIIGFVLVGPDPAHPCSGVGEEGLVGLHVFSRPKRLDGRGWALHGLEIGPNHEIHTRWTHVGRQGTAYPNSNLVTTRTASGEPGLVLAPIMDGDEAALLVLNARTGAVVDEVSFEGTPYFTMPLVVGDRVFLASRADRILVFEPTPASLWDRYRAAGLLTRLSRIRNVRLRPEVSSRPPRIHEGTRQP